MGRTIQDLEERILQKTGPLIGWARANQIPLSHLGKLWKLYVEPGIWWLVAALPITHAQADRLDLLQRKVARMLLGHGKRSPLPSALACLGWVPWSHLYGMCSHEQHVMTPAASWQQASWTFRCAPTPLPSASQSRRAGAKGDRARDHGPVQQPPSR